MNQQLPPATTTTSMTEGLEEFKLRQLLLGQMSQLRAPQLFSSQFQHEQLTTRQEVQQQQQQQLLSPAPLLLQFQPPPSTAFGLSQVHQQQFDPLLNTGLNNGIIINNISEQQPQSSGSGMETTTKVDLCAVCSDQAQGVHFGVVVCRACAAFFRRSTIAKRVYRCRFGGNCPIGQRDVRCSCRACRLAKCLSLGMDQNAVQRHRDQIGPRKQNNQDPMLENDNGNTNQVSKVQSRRLRNNENSRNIKQQPQQQTHNQPNVLLQPLSLMSNDFFKQHFDRIHNTNEEEEQQMNKKNSENSQSQQQLLHFEDGKSYALLGSSSSTVSKSTENVFMQNSQQQSQFQNLQSQPSTSTTALSDLLLRALPSAFSPVQPSLITAVGAATAQQQQFQQPDSGNVSASSSIFSSPANPGSTASALGTQNSPMNAATFIGLPTSSNGVNAAVGIVSPVTSTEQLSASSLLATASQSTDGNSTTTTLLSEMLRGFRKFFTLRRNKQPNDKSTKQNIQTNLKAELESIKADLSLLSKMVDEHFSPLHGNFSNESKLAFLRNFFGPFIIADRAYHSMLRFPKPEEQHLMACSPEGTFVDLRKLDSYFAVSYCHADPADVARIFEPLFRRIQQLVRLPMAELKISEKELVCLIGLLFWNDRVETLNDEERKLTTKTREQILVELYNLCHIGNNNTGGVERLGYRFCTLVNLSNILKKLSVEIALAFSLANAVKKLEADEFLHQFMPFTF